MAKLLRRTASVNSIDEVVTVWHAKEADKFEEAGEGEAQGPFVDRGWFNLLVGVVIALNAVTIGLETDARAGLPPNGRVSGTWYIFELLFCFIFLVELLCRLYFNGVGFFIRPAQGGLDQFTASGSFRVHGVRHVRPCWSLRTHAASLLSRLEFSNLLDFAIVFSSVLDSFILIPMGSGGDARFLSMLRFIRLLRVIRLIRLIKMLKELWLVASGLASAITTLAWLCVITVLVCFLGAILVTHLIGHNDELYDPYFSETGWDHEVYFATVARSLLTLVQVVTLDRWNSAVVRHVCVVQPDFRWFFLALICFAKFGVLNIIVGIVVEHTLATVAGDEARSLKAAQRDRSRIFDQLQEIFEDADADGNGTLDFAEVEAAISQPEIHNKLLMIDFPVDNPREVFDLVDYAGTGVCPISDFIEGCLKLTGPALSKDLLAGQVALDCMKLTFREFEDEVRAVQRKLSRLDATAHAIMECGEVTLLDMQKYRLRHPGARGSISTDMEEVLAKTVPWEEDPPTPDDKPFRLGAISPARPSRGGTTLPSERDTERSGFSAEFLLTRADRDLIMALD